MPWQLVELVHSTESGTHSISINPALSDSAGTATLALPLLASLGLALCAPALWHLDHLSSLPSPPLSAGPHPVSPSTFHVGQASQNKKSLRRAMAALGSGSGAFVLCGVVLRSPQAQRGFVDWPPLEPRRHAKGECGALGERRWRAGGKLGGCARDAGRDQVAIMEP